ncbi:MAG TPA: galactokinase family protein [Thermomicrobiales bacterium]|nr:galactokinase family protein [Thermomicrobiales bacterium]
MHVGYVPADPDLTGSVRRRARALWDVPPDVLVVTPGRIDIVGNHIDYNGGEPVAAAIDRWVALAARRRSDGIVRASVSDLGAGIAEFPIESATAFDLRRNAAEREWSDYARAAVAATHAAGIPCDGIDLYYRGTIPLGAGMGSFSALLVSAVAAIAQVAGARLSRLDIARCALEAGLRMDLPVGPLDPAICAVGGFLRFSRDEDRIRPLVVSLGDAIFVICDSGVRHSLSVLRYRARADECREALALLRGAGMPIGALAEISPADLDAAAGLLPEPLDRRVRHVVQEVERAREAEAAIEAGDCVALGALMTASGRSSATLYDISHPAVERIAAIARETPGVYGARMMGAGDGGVAVVLIERDALPALQRQLSGALVTLCRVARGLSMID